jgi:hypothetical protein
MHLLQKNTLIDALPRVKLNMNEILRNLQAAPASSTGSSGIVGTSGSSGAAGTSGSSGAAGIVAKKDTLMYKPMEDCFLANLTPVNRYDNIFEFWTTECWKGFVCSHYKRDIKAIPIIEALRGLTVRVVCSPKEASFVVADVAKMCDNVEHSRSAIKAWELGNLYTRGGKLDTATYGSLRHVRLMDVSSVC